MTEADAVRAMLVRRRVSPAIVERVMRLNPDPVPGQELRGLHYKHDRVWPMIDAQPKGAFIRSRGREAFDALPRSALLKRGRRVYVLNRWAR